MNFENFLQERIQFGSSQLKILFIFFLTVFIEAQEITLLGIINSIEQIDQQLIIIYSTFLFILWGAGCILGGLSSDYYGRKQTANYGIIGIGFFSILSMVLIDTEIKLFMFLRVFYAFWIGFTQPSMQTLAIEILPMQLRGKLMILFVGLAWPIGELFCLICAYYTLPNLYTAIPIKFESLDMLVAFLQIPIVLTFLFILLFLHESPRYLMLEKDYEMSILVVNKMLKQNKQEPISDEEISILFHTNINDIQTDIQQQQQTQQPHKKEHKNFHKLMNHHHRPITLRVSFMWFSLSYVYYGIIFILPAVLEHINKENFNIPRDTAFLDIGYTIGIEFLSVLVGYWQIDQPKIGRKYSITISFCLSALFSFLIFYYEVLYLTFFTSLLKFSSELCFILVYIYNSELFPTDLRSTAIGFCMFFNRLSCSFMPISVQESMNIHYFFPFFVMFCLSFLAFLCVITLQSDTQGKSLDIDSDSENEENISDQNGVKYQKIPSAETPQENLQINSNNNNIYDSNYEDFKENT